jgi:sec-independent protein translocase protein TatB
MFDVGFSELVVIGIIMLVVLGPNRLPEIARAAGRWAAKMRRFVDDMKRDMDTELRRDELAELRKVKDQLTETRHLFEDTAAGVIGGATAQSPAEPASGYLVKAAPDKSPAGKSRKSSARRKKAPARRAATKTTKKKKPAARKP